MDPFPTTNPAAATSRAVSRSNAGPDAPAHSGRAVPKFAPRSPSPAAASSASHAACAATSPSEWPVSPTSPGQCNPARFSGRPAANGWTSVPTPTRGSNGCSAGIVSASWRSANQDLVEQRLSLVLVRLLGKCKLTYENLPRLGQHALLASRKPALFVPAP